MSGFTNFLSTLFLGPRDIECVNNGGLTALDDGDSPLVYYIDMNKFSSLSIPKKQIYLKMLLIS